MASKTYAEQIADLQATRKSHTDSMRKLQDTAAEQARTLDAGEQEEFDTAKEAVKTIDKNIANLRELEAIEKDEQNDAATAKPVSQKQRQAEPVQKGVSTVQVKNTEKLEPGIAFARVSRCLALSHIHHKDPVDIAKSMYPGDDNLIAGLTAKAAVSAANTMDATWAGNLINEGGIAFADFVEYLRPRTLLGQISSRLRRLPFDTPVLVQGSAGSASWVKEGAAKPVTEWTYTRAKLAPLKVASIAAATKETLMRASAAADTLLRDELARAVGTTIDTKFISDDAAVTDESPAGILNGVSALTLAGDGTVAGIRADVAQMLKELVGNNLTVTGAFWVMPETVAIDLSLIVNEVGASAFPGIGPSGGTFAGLPVFTTQYVPTESAGPVVALMKGDEIFLGDEDGIQVSMSDQASLVMDSAPSATNNSVTSTPSQLVSLWQTNSVAFLVERFLNWQKRRSQAVVWANVNWTSAQASP